MAELDHTPGGGCIILDNEIVYFDIGVLAQPGDPVVVIDYAGKLVVISACTPYSTHPEAGYVYGRLVDTPQNHLAKLPLVGAVTRRVATTHPLISISADNARGLAADANRGPVLRERITALIHKVASEGRLSIAVELMNTPDEDRQMLFQELVDAGFAPTMSERPIKQTAYGDKSDVYLLTCSWAR
jgi:hypothetical protein